MVTLRGRGFKLSQSALLLNLTTTDGFVEDRNRGNRRNIPRCFLNQTQTQTLAVKAAMNARTIINVIWR